MNLSTKTPDSETDTPQFTKTLSFTNGNRYLQPSQQQQQQQPMMVVYHYKECLKNHAASIGGYSLDGCGEFMPAPNANPSDPSSLKCAACGCHRNFHRREPDDHVTTTTTTHFLNFHQRLPMSSSSPSLSPKSPQPVQQAYYTSAAPHMLLALSSGVGGGGGGVPGHQQQKGFVESESLAKRKRFRTKFSQEQKEKMYVLADKLGWKMQKSEDKLVEEFCKDVGVPRRVFKVWMHNNKNLVKRANDHVAAAAAHDDDDSININVDGNCKKEDSEANVGGARDDDDDDNAVHAGSSSSSYERI